MPNELWSIWTYFIIITGISSFGLIAVLHCIGLKWPTSKMANRILKFMIGNLGLGSNVQLDLVDFKVLCSANKTGFNWPTGF